MFVRHPEMSSTTLLRKKVQPSLRAPLKYFWIRHSLPHHENCPEAHYVIVFLRTVRKSEKIGEIRNLV